MTDCVFCKIVRGELPAEKVYEDQETLAFLDITPVNPGHVLVIPKTHYENIFDIPEDLFGRLMQKVKMLAPNMKAATGADGVNIGMNNGRAAGQIVDHAHVHIMPRRAGDGHQLWHGMSYREGEMQSVAEKIRKEMRATGAEKAKGTEE